MAQERKRLPRDHQDHPLPPDPMPTDTGELLDYMDDAFHSAIVGDPGSPTWERAKILFDLLHSNFQFRSATELGEAHRGLERATKTLKVATWWLAVITVFLGIVELLGLFHN